MSEEFSNMLGSFVEWIPRLVEAIIILIIGWIIAWILERITTGAIQKSGLSRKVSEYRRDSAIRKIFGDPARSIGRFVYWLILIITFTMVIDALNIPILTELVHGVYGYVPNILAAIVILLAALALSVFFGGVIRRWMGDTPTGEIATTIIPVVIMSIAGFAILEQLQIAPIIITTTYIAIMGSLALGLGLAFGLGGKDVAGKILSDAYNKGSRSMEQIRQDIRKARERATEDKEKIRDRFKKA